MRTLLFFFLALPIAAYAQLGGGSVSASRAVSYANQVNAVREAAAVPRMSKSSMRGVAQFSQSLQRLGLWSDATDIWLMRSGYNAGTGSVVFGLKGSNNGSMVNGPAWGVDGLVTSLGGNSYVNPSITYNFDSSSTVMFVGALTPTSSTGRRIFGQASANTTSLYPLLTSDTTTSFRNASFFSGNAAIVNFSTIDLDGFNFYATSLNASSTTANWLSARKGASGTANWSNPVGSHALHILAGQVSADYWTGQAAMAGYFSRNLTASEIQSVRNAYNASIMDDMGYGQSTRFVADNFYKAFYKQ